MTFKYTGEKKKRSKGNKLEVHLIFESTKNLLKCYLIFIYLCISLGHIKS